MQSATEKEKDLHLIISNLLRVGIISCVLVALVGGAIYLSRNGSTLVDYDSFDPVPNFLNLENLFASILQLRGRAIIQGGIILLIATPVLRVIISGIAFFMEKDYLYTFITFIVLCIIILSTIYGHSL